MYTENSVFSAEKRNLPVETLFPTLLLMCECEASPSSAAYPDSVSSYSFQATWVGGGFILGVAEAVYTPKMGLIWALMPVQYSMSFVFGKEPNTVQPTAGALVQPVSSTQTKSLFTQNKSTEMCKMGTRMSSGLTGLFAPAVDFLSIPGAGKL